MQRARSVAAALWIAPLALCAAFAAYTAVGYYPVRSSIDLYHPWGIVQAHDALGRASNPYADTTRYGAHIYAMAGAAPDRTLRWARAFWRSRSDTGIEPTGTPLFYAMHVLAPRDFQSLRLLHTILAYAAILFAVTVLARLRGAGWPAAACAATLVAGTFNPFIDSVHVGNVGAMQLAVLAVLLGVAQRGAWRHNLLMDRGYLALLAVLVLFKPNVLFIAAGLAAHYGIVRGARRFAAGGAIALVAAFLAVALSSAYFGSASVWLDWLRYLQGANGGTLEYTFEQGNMALPMFMFAHTDWIAPQTWATLFAATFVLVLLAYATSQGREPQRLVPVARAWLADPWVAASVPALAMFAASPLLWPHYLVFALIPIAWVAHGPRHWTIACAVAAFVGMSLFVSGPLVVADLKELVKPAVSYSWTLLLPAAVARLSRAARAVPA
jgi:hypothetical protein